MQQERHFSRFRLDLANEQLWQGDEEIRLRGKTFQVLRYLVARPGQLVTKQALLDGVWGQVAVSDSMPSICIAELRKALGDDPGTPKLIETVHGRGYRFIAQFKGALASSRAVPAPGSTPLMVGREEELAQIREWFATASQGRRRVVFVTGESGIGKTTFLQSFLADLVGKRLARIGCGQCVEQYGAGEPYMPVLEALTRLAQEPNGDQLVEILRRLAPTWLAQMPALMTLQERVKLQSEMQVMTQQRMLRELAEAIEALAAETPLVLLLEDLHWSDFSTLELLSVVARRTEAACLFVIGSYRPVEMLASAHRLRAMKEELELHRQCEELRLKPLDARDVGDYIRRRFGGKKRARSLEQAVPMIHQRTEGNPLFMVNVVDYLVERGSPLRTIEAPRTITQMIERNLESLKPEEQTLLEAASAAGAEFSAAAVAAALHHEIGEVESGCARLARREQFVAPQGAVTWPDGTVAAAFRFYHALYQEVLYQRVPAGWRGELHRRIARRQEKGWGDRAAEIAAELAYHFGRCGDKARALKYLELAGQRAVARRAYAEADKHYSDALAVLETTPESPQRDRREVSLLLALGEAVGVLQGFSPAKTEAAYTRASILTERAGGRSLEVLRGLWNATVSRGELRAALALANQFLEIAQRSGILAALPHAHYLQALPRSLMGDIIEARDHFNRALELYSEEDNSGSPLNPGLGSLTFSIQTESILGHPEVAIRRLDGAIALARRQDNPYALALASGLGAREYAIQGNFRRSLEASGETVRLSTEFGFRLTKALGKINIAWVRARSGEVDNWVGQIRQGLAEVSAQNFLVYRSWNLQLLAEVQALTGCVDEALITVEQALRTNPDELLHRPEALRLRGELRLKSTGGGKTRAELAEGDFREAIELARKIAAKSHELRATTSLARLLKRQGRRKQARTMLSKIYSWFTEGFDTEALKSARSLLEQLA